jgi:hypothetical protein
MGSGGGGTTVQAAQESPEQRAYFAQLARDIEATRQKKEAQEQAEATRLSNLRTAGKTNLGSYSNIFQQQLKSGALTSSAATDQLKDFQQRYGLEAGDIEPQLQAIKQYELEQLPEQRTTLVQRTFQDILGRKASDQELKTRLDEIAKSGGKLDIDAIGTSIKSSDEYKEKVGGSYLENYYRTYFGPGEKVTVKGTEGAPDWQKSTGRYTVSTGTAFSPTLDKETQKTVGLKFGAMPDTFTGSVGEIEQMQQKMRQRDEFAYNSGLTKLQGQIDADIQKIKNKGSKDVAEISSKTGIYGNLVSGFW